MWNPGMLGSWESKKRFLRITLLGWPVNVGQFKETLEATF